MIKDPAMLSYADSLSLTSQVLLKVAGNFWWVILLAIGVSIFIHIQESSNRR
jgi:hypothetical protein